MNAPDARMEGVSAVILAAGKGTRMRSPIAKVLHPFCGRPIIHWVVDAVEALQLPEVVMVIGHQAEAVREALSSRPVRFAVQEPQMGTAHALMAARRLLEGRCSHVLTCCGDTPLIGFATLRKLLERHMEGRAAITLLIATLEEPGGYGRILRGISGSVQAIVEERDATPEALKIREINSGFYVFEADFLWGALEMLRFDNAQGEYYLTDLVAMARELSLGVEAVEVEDPLVIKGINTKEELEDLERIFMKRRTETSPI